ncbi:zinc-binding dehydrogenase [Cystobacter fuscus]|nr:zinc-binding dehydrogenase [Cystobacter fuscus]
MAKRFGGVDLVVNPVGTDVLDQTLVALHPAGEVAIMGLMEFSERPLDVITLMSKNLRFRGISVGNAEMHAAMVREMDAHRVRPPSIARSVSGMPGRPTAPRPRRTSSARS